MKIPTIEAKWYVAEVVNGKETRVTKLYAYKADAVHQLDMMREHGYTYVVRNVDEERKQDKGLAEIFAAILMSCL